MNQPAAHTEPGVLKLQERDVFDTRPTGAREGGREVAMDDHAVRRIPANWRWNYLGATFTAFGVSTAMIYPLSGALYTLAFGAKAALIAGLVSAVYAVAVTYYINRHVINEGINADLISRSTFGYIGSAFNALLYATVCAFYFAAEGSVMAHALHEVVPAVPYWGWAVLTSATFLILGLFGMVLLSKIQWSTLVFYFLGLGLAFYALVAGWNPDVSVERMSQWLDYAPPGVPFDFWTVLEAIGAYIGVLGAILAVFTTDVARFIRREDRGFGGFVFVVVNTLFPVLIMYTIGIQMFAASGQPDPGVTLVRLLGTLGLVVTLLTQVRINLLNLYGGTIGLANFCARIFGFIPGRAFWVVPFLLIATAIVLTPFRENFGYVSIYISIFLCSWVSTLIGERVFVRGRYRLPSWSEVRRAYLPDWNPVGIASMWIPVLISCVMASGIFGRHVRALAVPTSIALPFVLPAIIASMLSKPRLIRAYVGRDIDLPPVALEVLECGVCHKGFHRSDFAACPFHNGQWICSYCCISELRCQTLCRKESSVAPTLPLLEA
ncbi:MAG: cytosine permease [Candidatus Binatia bacterium]